ncbi:MAG: glycoside hydrolase family 9 protein [Ruminiclostridium sp.]|nr:glycoside hydrolase family 9 protein [Ruminiclostridium sp.]
MISMYGKKKEPTFGSSSPFRIYVDQAGYLPGSRKIAVLPFPATLFAIVDENGDKFFEGEVTHFGTDECSGDDVYIADFSTFSREGSYRVTTGGKTSALFRIGDAVYNKLFFAVTKAFYYFRCGCELDERFAGAFTHARCHCSYAELLTEDGEINVRGGWHDAGDYGRYVTAGACACAQLLYAYKLFPGVFERLDLNIPESGSGIPDLLSECRYELEWMVRMQREDGAVFHKVTTMNHAPFVMPENDTSKLYVFSISSSATADFCAVCALASGVFRQYDEEFSKRLQRAAVRAYSWLEEHPDPVRFFNPSGCNTGVYGEEFDFDNRYWAAAEMYELTGESKYNEAFRALCNSRYFEGQNYIKTSLGYGNIGGLGSLAYILSGREGKDKALCGKLADLFVAEAYWLADKTKKSGYGASMEDWEYFWGSNMELLHHGMKFVLAAMMTGEEDFYGYAEEQLHVLLGRNALGISYVTGFGEYACRNPHYRPSAADGIEESVPGLVIGGPNSELNDPYAKTIVPSGTPPMKCYADDERCFSLNETTIYWNSPAVFLLAALETHKNK